MKYKKFIPGQLYEYDFGKYYLKNQAEYHLGLVGECKPYQYYRWDRDRKRIIFNKDKHWHCVHLDLNDKSAGITVVPGNGV